jgi:predicted DCC family thiol-disulfide oxidoreductase YuxK
MDAHFFEYYALYAVFVPWASIGPFLSKCFSLKKEGQCNPQIFFDGRCILCIRSMVFLSYFDLFKRLEFRDLNVHGTEWAATQPQVQLEDMYRQMYVSGANGQIYKGFFAFRRLIRYLPVFWLVGPLFYMPFSSYLGPYVYRFIASRRVGLGPCGSDACMIHPERISQ